MKLKSKILIVFLILSILLCFCSTCFAVQSYHDEDKNLHFELPDFPFDLKESFPNRNYFMCIFSSLDDSSVTCADLYILPEGYYLKSTWTYNRVHFIRMYDSNNSMQEMTKVMHYSYISGSDGWKLTETTCYFNYELSDIARGYFVTNRDIVDDRGTVVFPQTLTPLMALQTQAGKVVTQGIQVDLAVLVPVGLVIFSSLLVVFLIASRKWLLM